MSQSSTNSHVGNRRVHSLQNERSISRDASRPRKRSISYNDAYLYALRVAYLAYLLSPRQKRTRHVPAKPTLVRAGTSTSINDLMKDFSLVRDSKSTKVPKGFIAELEKRIVGVVVGKENRPEYQDHLVKRTFAAFFNTLSAEAFKKSMEQDRRPEDLVLIFFSNATKELQKGKPPGDDTVKRMVDRHLALFVRLMSLILKEHAWSQERPELATRLFTLEEKLLKHDEDLSTAQSSGQGTTVEELVPLSYEVKDMPLVLAVGRIFGLTNTMIQSDLTKHKPVWTAKAALQDLKTYQSQLNLGSRRTLNSHDFDTQEAYEAWKKAEAPELSHMMLAIIQSHPDLAKSTSQRLPQFDASANGSRSPDAEYADLSRALQSTGNYSSYVFDQPVDLSGLDLHDDTSSIDDAEQIYTFIPQEPRAMYRFILSQALSQDLNSETSERDGDTSGSRLLSKQSTDLLNEIALRWRIPKFSRIVLFLDVIREKFIEQQISLDNLDAAFRLVKEAAPDGPKNKRSSIVMTSMLEDRYKWTVADFALMQQVLSGMHDALQRDLYGVMMQCYDNKVPPLLGPILTILDVHITSDPSFTPNANDMQQFQAHVAEGLANRARELYSEFVDKEIPQDQETWEFYHVTQLGKSVLKLAERIQKRYRKNPEIAGVNPLKILLSCIFPAYEGDCKAMVESVIAVAKSKGEEIPIQDGFDLYAELSEFRRVHADALPGIPFAFSVEELLADFVWRWIKVTEQQIDGWVDNAIKQDQFSVRSEQQGQPPAQDERHSVSVIDIFRSFNQVIDQVAQLNWDDDLAYAKFMTSLSKAIGNGISRYCEVLEHMFTKEMDRLSPEQEMAASQTRQEKWMQLARDTWNQKDRVEPFQFYPQSFVKLNNISFALTQWDKLEREINVDACAKVIRQHTPPVAQRPKKNTNYVFTIKIVEAEDLKAMDVSGYSDPYVVLADEYQKRLSKTRIMYRNLNPRWDESVDISTQGALNLMATIWDWDAIGDHDYIGRTSLKLDPAHFGDFLPREYWLDLDTQGRLLVRVSMEGERDDIQFYFGKAFRTLKRTERDMTRKITDKLSAYINHCLSRRALRSLLSRGISMSSISSVFHLNRTSVLAQPSAPTETDILRALEPLFTYFNDNFAVMKQTLTTDAMIAVMTRLWKEVLVTIESLLVPPLSDKPSHQKPLTQQELDIIFKWLQSLFDFFHAVDDDTGEVNGVPQNVLKSPKYHEIQTLNFFYFETTDNLIRTSERMASATAAQANRSRMSAPPTLGGNLAPPGTAMSTSRRTKSIMMSRNLGTMRKAKEEKWKAAQAEPSDDMILRILRMRPEASGYLRDRSRQKERLAAVAAAEAIVHQSLLGGTGGGRMVSDDNGIAGRRGGGPKQWATIKR